MLNTDDSLILVIDIQDRLVNSLNKVTIINKSSVVLKAANILKIPVIVTEQYPRGLGNTISQLKEILDENVDIVEKTSFNAIADKNLLDRIKSFNRKQILIMGIETHICVYQTALALLEQGFEVYAIKDACASREKYEFKQGIYAMAQNGVKITCVEMALFEWLKDAKNPKFKEIQALIK